MAALREIFARFGVEFDRAGAVQRGDRATSGLTDRLRQLGAVVGGTMLVRGLVRMGTDVMRLADDLDKLSQQVGLTAREFQAYSHAAALAGVQQQQLTVALSAMLRNANAANRGATEMRAAFRRAGIESVATGGRLKSTSELLGELADGLMDVENEGERTALTMTLLGEEGRRLLPMLAQGSAGLAGMEAELDRLGGGASEEFIRRSVEINDNLTRWRMALLSLKTQLMIGFMPTLNRIIARVTSMSAAVAGNEALVRLLKIAFTTLGVVAVAAAVKAGAAWLVAGWPLALIAAVVIGLALAVDDLWTTWQGGDSMLRRFINGIFPGVVGGLDATDRAVRGVVDAFVMLTSIAGNTFDVFAGGVAGIWATVIPRFQIFAAGMEGVTHTLVFILRMIQAILTGGSAVGEVVGDYKGMMTNVARRAGSALTSYPGAMASAGRRAGSGARGLVGDLPALIGRPSGYAAMQSDAILPSRFRAEGAALRGGRVSPTKVDARQTNTITVVAATDPEETERRVRRVVRDENDRQARQLAATLAGAST